MIHDLIESNQLEVLILNDLDLLFHLEVVTEISVAGTDLGNVCPLNMSILSLRFGVLYSNLPFVIQSPSYAMSLQNALVILKVAMEGLLFVDLSFLEVLKVEVLQGQVLVRLRLIDSVIFDPGDLQHDLEALDCQWVLLDLLVDLAHLFVNDDCLSVIICILY